MSQEAKASPAARATRPGDSARGPHSRALALLALAVAVFALTAAPASANPPTVKVGTISDVSYASARVAGSVKFADSFALWEFQYSTDGTDWIGGGSGFLQGSENEQAIGPVDFTGLKGGTTYFVRLRATNFLEEGVTQAPHPEFTTLPVDPPVIVATDDASGIFSTSATATGTVKRPANADPAFDVKCRFEYVTQADFTANGYAGATARDCQPSPIGPADANTDKAVSAALGCTNPPAEAPEEKCLKPGTTYHLRMVTENASPTVVAKESTNSFTTAPAVAKPTVIAVNDATDIDYLTAKVTGEVQRPTGTDPALNTNCRFEYVKDVDFKATQWEKATPTPCVEAPVEAPLTGAAPTHVSAELSGMKPTTTYHLRLTAENGSGAVSKEATTFTTRTGEDPTMEVLPVSPSKIGYTQVEVSGIIDSGKPDHILFAQYQVSPDPSVWTIDGEHGFGIYAPSGKHEYPSPLLKGLRPNTKYYVRLAALDVFNDYAEIFTTAPYVTFTTKGTSAPPIADLDPVADVPGTSAHFSGTVDPNGPGVALPDDGKAAYRTEWHYECIPECKDINENPIGGVIEAEEGIKPAIGDVARLAPNTEYEVRLIASNLLGTVEGPIRTFRTAHFKPTVKAAEGASDGKGGYTIQGTVNPNNSKVTTCTFEWGPTAPDYAFEAPCSPQPAGRNEVQNVVVADTSEFFLAETLGGQFKLTYHRETTPDLPYNASPAEVRSALEALPKIGAGSVAVTRQARFGVWVVTFQGKLAQVDVPQITVRSGTVPITGIPGSGGAIVIEGNTKVNGGNAFVVTVEAHLPGLTPGAVYHYNLVATNGAGKSQSGDTEFVPTIITPDVCANEKVRKESRSLALPECRAYEMVSPPGKEGYRAALQAWGTGDSVAYASGAGNLFKSGTNQALFGSQYVTLRSATGWNTIPNLNGVSGTIKDAPSYVTGPVTGPAFYSEDLRTTIWGMHRQDGVPGNNLYLRNEDGTFTLIGPNDGTTGMGPFEDRFVSADLKHIVNSSGFGGAPSMWGKGVYETIGTGNVDPPRRIDVDNSGTPISSCEYVDEHAVNALARSLSKDGRIIVFVAAGGCGGSNPPADEMWARVDGTTSFDVSASQCTRTVPACNDPANTQFVGSASDNSRVFFTTTQQLVNGDTDETKDIYACDLPTGTPTPAAGKANHCAAFRQVSVAKTGGADVELVLNVSEDGSTVLFAAKGILADNKDTLGQEAVPGDHNFYVWHSDVAHPDGQTTFVSRLKTLEFGANTQITPDGRYIVFSSTVQLISTDTDSSIDVYRYDVEAGKVSRASTNVVGVAGNGDGFDIQIPPHAVSDDGSKIIFASAEALSPVDGNAEQDLYLWTPERVSLISTGAVLAGVKDTPNGNYGRNFAAIDGSGQNIFFHTGAPLTPADPDDSVDIYDARIGGGFSFAEPVPCAGEACQPAASGSPPASLPATDQLPADPGNVTPRKCFNGKVLKGEKCVKKGKKKKSKKKKSKKKKKKAGHGRGGSK